LKVLIGEDRIIQDKPEENRAISKALSSAKRDD
jgi:hypothetical protein